VHVDLSKWPINQLKPVQQIRQQALKAYCPNIYTVTLSVETVQDFMIKLEIKPLMHLLEVGIFFTK